MRERERERGRRQTPERRVCSSPRCLVLPHAWFCRHLPISLIVGSRWRERNTHTQTCIYKCTRTLGITVIHARRTREVKKKSFPAVLQLPVPELTCVWRPLEVIPDSTLCDHSYSTSCNPGNRPGLRFPITMDRKLSTSKITKPSKS